MKSFLGVTLVLLLGVTLFVAQAAQPQRAARLTIEQLVDIRHPSNPVWSPDGRRVAFLSERAGIANISVADVDGTAPAQARTRAVTRFADGLTGGLFWSADSQRLYFPRQGDLWQVPSTGGDARTVWTTPQVETGMTPSPDGTRVAFVRAVAGAPPPTESAAGGRGGRGRGGAGAELVVRTLADGRETLVLRADNHAIGGVSWSPDGQTLLFNDAMPPIRHEQTPAYSGSKIIYTITENVPGETSAVAASGGAPTSLGILGGFGGRRWLDARHVLVDRQSGDYKRRTISVFDIAGAEPKTMYEEFDSKFWSIPGGADPNAQPSPDGKWIAFVSDRDGWDHIYVVPSAGGAAIQITKGRFEAWRPQWSHDSARIAFDANEPDHPGDRHLGIAMIGRDAAHPRVTMITSGRGTDTAPVWSPDDKHLVFQHTDPHSSADLVAIDTATGVGVRLSESMPNTIDPAMFVEPEFVHYPGPDGQPVPGWLFVPRNLDRSKKHPAVVWIHGDGVNQNYDGWHVQRNYAVYYSFHQYLLQKGYVVFAPDYRGSIGYGKAWRQGVYMDVGGNDAKDAWMAAHYLKTLPYVDSERLGVWGLSYGGFFTLIAVTDQPTLYRAAVDVAGVVDYAMYYEDPYHGGWTVSRIGTPEQNPKVYAQASPLSHVDRLARPLLVLHGTSDVNVPYLHSVRLIDELLKKGKNDLVTFMTYPGEFHYFTRDHVLRDAWHRVEDFFDANLKHGTVTSH